MCLDQLNWEIPFKITQNILFDFYFTAASTQLIYLLTTCTGYSMSGVAVKVGTSKLFTSSFQRFAIYLLPPPASLTLLFVAVHLLALLVTLLLSLRPSVTHTHTHTLSHIKSIIKTFLTSHFHSWQLFSADAEMYATFFFVSLRFLPARFLCSCSLTQLFVVLLADGEKVQ